jgi:hypothetical protein
MTENNADEDSLIVIISSIFFILIIVIIFIIIKKLIIKKEEKKIQDKIIKDNIYQEDLIEEKITNNYTNNISNNLSNTINNLEKLSEDELKKEYEKQLNLSKPTPEEEKSLVESTLKELINNKNFWIQIGSTVAASLVVKASLRMAQRVGIKIQFKIGAKILLSISKVLTRIAVRTGTKMLARLGAKIAIAAATGPGAPFVLVAQLAYEVLSNALDVTDAGGYMKLDLGTKEYYFELRNELENLFKSEVEKSGAKWPLIKGPMDDISIEEFTKKIEEKTNFIMDITRDPLDPLYKPFYDKLMNDVISGLLTEADLENDEIFNNYEKNNLDTDAIFNKVFSDYCGELNGKIIDRGNNIFECSWKNKEQCEKYTWPNLTEDQIYTEFKPNLFGGACLVSSFGIRSLCDSNNQIYNTETGMCEVTEEYCKKKGAQWNYNDNIKEFDCNITDTQEVFEFIFGSTITRGLIQIFDPDQYEPCKPGEIDDGYFCRTVRCPEGYERDSDAALICYPKCTYENYSQIGDRCYKNCYSDEIDVGLLCRKKCREGYNDIAGVCWADTYTRSVGKIPVNRCPWPGFEPRGVGNAGWCDNGPRWDFWNLKTRNSVKDCPMIPLKNGQPNWEITDGLCYEKCKPGYVNRGCCICAKQGETSYVPQTVAKTSYSRIGNEIGAVNIRPKKRRIPFSTKDN